jgi:predicted component of type VI protein secretion system
MALELQIQEKGGPARTQIVPKEVAFFGRREDNDIILPYTFVSSRHGRILRRGSAVFVEDMGSTNGTTVNGQPLTPMVPHPLKPEDQVEIEKVFIRARFVEEFEEPDVPATFHEDVPRPTPASTAAPDTGATVRIAPAASPALTASLPAPSPAPLPTPPAPVPPGPSMPSAAPEVRPEAPSTMWEIQTGTVLSAAARAEAAEAAGAVRLGTTSLPDVIASGRTLQRLRAEEAADRYLLYEMLFKGLGLLAILAGLVLVVMILAA